VKCRVPLTPVLGSHRGLFARAAHRLECEQRVRESERVCVRERVCRRVGIGEREIGRASEMENTRRRKRSCGTKRERSGERSCGRSATVYDGSGARREHTEAITILGIQSGDGAVAGEREFWKDEIINYRKNLCSDETRPSTIP